MTQALYAHMNNKRKRKKKRKCAKDEQWNFTQPQVRMKFCHSKVNGWNWRTLLK
jgi:hypothetical protein